jgi:UDP-3-O-[3-hydroxymyristoyl] glucosamine N-acyltransferase
MQNHYTLGEIAKIIDAQLTGNPDSKIYSVASLKNATQGQISFLVPSRYQLVMSNRFLKLLPTTNASAVLLAPEHQSQCQVDTLVMSDPYKGLIEMSKLFKKTTAHYPGIHPTAIIGKNCHIAATASIGAYAVLGDNCDIDADTIIGPYSFLGQEVSIGAQSTIHPRVTIEQNVTIGDRAVIYSGAVIGSEGFGLVRQSQGWCRIPHLGTVILGNDVEIGANTTIDRGSVDDTVIGNGVKLDNQIQIGHGVNIDDHTVIAGCVGIGGSTRIGKNCMIGGATTINDNIIISDNIIVTGMSQVSKSLSTPGVYSSGTHIQPYDMWRKNTARLNSLDKLAKKIFRLEKEQHD